MVSGNNLAQTRLLRYTVNRSLCTYILAAVQLIIGLFVERCTCCTVVITKCCVLQCSAVMVLLTFLNAYTIWILDLCSLA